MKIFPSKSFVITLCGILRPLGIEDVTSFPWRIFFGWWTAVFNRVNLEIISIWFGYCFQSIWKPFSFYQMFRNIQLDTFSIWGNLISILWRQFLFQLDTISIFWKWFLIQLDTISNWFGNRFHFIWKLFLNNLDRLSI